MNDLQDLLLDKMVGVKAGPLWKDGPFCAAAGLLPGKPIKFRGRHGDHAARNAVSTRLGYPRMLLEAAHGALSVLPGEDDRRSFAMAVILAIPPGIKQKPRPANTYRVAAVAITRRAHALACKHRGCEVLPVFDAVLRAEGVDAQVKAFAGFAGRRCPTYGFRVDRMIQLVPKTAATDRTIHAAQNCAKAYGDAQPAHEANSAAREACRAAAMLGGADAALAVCRDLARRLGLPGVAAE